MNDSTRLRVRVARRLRRLKVLWTDLQVAIATGAILAYLLMRFPFVRDLIEQLGADPEFIEFAILVPIVLGMILWQTVQITHQLEDVQGSSVPGRTLLDVTQSFPELIQQSGRKRSLDVVGISLRDSWSLIRQRLDGEELRGWTIRLSAFTGDASALGAPSHWADHAKLFLSEAEAYGQKKSTRAKGVSLLVFEHDHPPIVHGFRFGNGEIFLAVMQWEKNATRLSGITHSYEHVKAGDKSVNAQAKRELFDSWVRSAQVRPFKARGPEDPTDDATPVSS